MLLIRHTGRGGALREGDDRGGAEGFQATHKRLFLSPFFSSTMTLRSKTARGRTISIGGDHWRIRGGQFKRLVSKTHGRSDMLRLLEGRLRALNMLLFLPQEGGKEHRGHRGGKHGDKDHVVAAGERHSH